MEKRNMDENSKFRQSDPEYDNSEDAVFARTAAASKTLDDRIRNLSFRKTAKLPDNYRDSNVMNSINRNEITELDINEHKLIKVDNPSELETLFGYYEKKSISELSSQTEQILPGQRKFNFEKPHEIEKYNTSDQSGENDKNNGSYVTNNLERLWLECCEGNSKELNVDDSIVKSFRIDGKDNFSEIESYINANIARDCNNADPTNPLDYVQRDGKTETLSLVKVEENQNSEVYSVDLNDGETKEPVAYNVDSFFEFLKDEKQPSITDNIVAADRKKKHNENAKSKDRNINHFISRDVDSNSDEVMTGKELDAIIAELSSKRNKERDNTTEKTEPGTFTETKGTEIPVSLDIKHGSMPSSDMKTIEREVQPNGDSESKNPNFTHKENMISTDDSMQNFDLLKIQGIRNAAQVEDGFENSIEKDGIESRNYDELISNFNSVEETTADGKESEADMDSEELEVAKFANAPKKTDRAVEDDTSEDKSKIANQHIVMAGAIVLYVSVLSLATLLQSSRKTKN